MDFEVYTSPDIHRIPGQVFQGINVEVTYDAEVGSVSENDIVIWGTHIFYDIQNPSLDTFIAGEYICLA